MAASREPMAAQLEILMAAITAPDRRDRALGALAGQPLGKYGTLISTHQIQYVRNATRMFGPPRDRRMRHLSDETEELCL